MVPRCRVSLTNACFQQEMNAPPVGSAFLLGLLYYVVDGNISAVQAEPLRQKDSFSRPNIALNRRT